LRQIFPESSRRILVRVTFLGGGREAETDCGYLVKQGKEGKDSGEEAHAHRRNVEDWLGNLGTQKRDRETQLSVRETDLLRESGDVERQNDTSEAEYEEDSIHTDNEDGDDNDTR
jgi:hypothetical protein